MKRYFLVVAVCLGLALPVLADDVQPPWWRGQYSTTSQVWEFWTPDSGWEDYDGDGTPDGLRPDGPALGGEPPLPSTKVYITPIPGGSYIPIDPNSGREGIWPLSGWIDVIVDNHDPKPENEKWIWVQITWRPQDVGEFPIIEAPDPPPVTGPDIVLEEDLGFGWTETTYTWTLDWNPPWESFTITGTIDVDELVIDTWCVPEPTTMAFVALGGLALLRRR
jgi:hypothetical protein